MGFLKKFFRNVLRDGSFPSGTSSFESLSEDELESHLGVSRYGDFQLTDAIRPSYDLKVVPCQGYRHDSYRDEQNRTTVPVLMAACSRDRLFDLFMDVLEPLGNVVDVVLETSHNHDRRRAGCRWTPVARGSVRVWSGAPGRSRWAWSPRSSPSL